MNTVPTSRHQHLARRGLATLALAGLGVPLLVLMHSAPASAADLPPATTSCSTEHRALEDSVIVCAEPGTTLLAPPVDVSTVNVIAIGGGTSSTVPWRPENNGADVRGRVTLPPGTSWLKVVVGAGGTWLNTRGGASGVVALDKNREVIATLVVAEAGGPVESVPDTGDGASGFAASPSFTDERYVKDVYQGRIPTLRIRPGAADQDGEVILMFGSAAPTPASAPTRPATDAVSSTLALRSNATSRCEPSAPLATICRTFVLLPRTR